MPEGARHALERQMGDMAALTRRLLGWLGGLRGSPGADVLAAMFDELDAEAAQGSQW